MLTSVAGTDEKTGEPYVYEAGEEYELPQKVAKDFCSRPEDMPRAEPVAVTKRQRAETRA